MEREAVLVAGLCAPPDRGGGALRFAARYAHWLHVPAERCGDLDPDWIHSHFPGSLIYSLARSGPGAQRADDEGARAERLRWAARCYDLVELEAPHDLKPDLLDHVPPAKRLVTWRGVASDVRALGREFERMAAVEAHAYRLVCVARRPAEALVPLELLASLRRDDTVAYAEGAGGFWSRLIAPHLGCPMVFGRIGDGPEPADDPSIDQLVRDYGLPRLTRPRELFGIIGDPVHASLSPRLHNAGYREHGRAALYLPFEVQSFPTFWDQVVCSPVLESLDMTFEGFTVVSPHKEAAREVSRTGSELVRRAASCNLLRRVESAWVSETTDPQGVLDCLRSDGRTAGGRRAAVIGCGGAGRPIAAMLASAGYEVSVVNRGEQRGRWAGRILGLAHVPLEEFQASEVSVVVHATPLGRRETDPLPFDPGDLPADAVLVDLVYGPQSTRLAAGARARGCRVHDGYEVLRAQVRRQFERMTGLALPAALAAALVGPDRAQARLERDDAAGP